MLLSYHKMAQKRSAAFKLKIQQFTESLFASVQCDRLGKPIATTV